MSGFVKLIFISAMMFLGCSLASANSLKCISMNNQQCKVRPLTVNVNSEEPLFFPFNIKTSKCSGSCNNINDPYAKLCAPDVIKNLNVRVFNLMWRTNETRHIECMKLVSVNVDLMEVFVIINNFGIKINAGVNA